MDQRKQDEIEHYDKKARAWRGGEGIAEARWHTDVHGVAPELFSSYKWVATWMNARGRDKEILDFGCGTGIHAVKLAKAGARTIGIDLSEESLQIARERARRAGVDAQVTFLKMDCERLEFPNRSLDMIFDGGTFSSIDINKALPELARVLTLDGYLVGIETLGHNPLANLKRKLNVRRGARTPWAEQHIFKLDDFKKMERYFGAIEAHYFHLFSIALLPFLRFPGAKTCFRLLDRIDKLLLKIRGLQKFAFKVVFVASEPKHR